MKNINRIKETVLQVTLIASVLLVASCDNNQKPQGTKVVAEDQNEAKFDNKQQEKDAQFLVDAAEINLEEIQLGQLAQDNGTTEHVKELGRMMEEAHTKSLSDLTVLAKSKMVSIPTSPTENAHEAYRKLNGKSGTDFDKAYADLMVDGHKNAIETFEKASTDGNDADVKNWARATLPDLRIHLDHSLICQKKCDKI